MSSREDTAAQVDANSQAIGKAALVASVGGQRGFADWTNPDHRLRRLLAEFIGVAGLTFILSGGAAILVRYGGQALQLWQTVLVLSACSALWLVVAVYFLGPLQPGDDPGIRAAAGQRLGGGRCALGRSAPGPRLWGSDRPPVF